MENQINVINSLAHTKWNCKYHMPFELKLSSSKPLAISTMTREQLDKELQKGVDSIKAGKVYSADEVDASLAKEFGI